MAEYKLGKICPIFRGNWSSNETYDRLDVVTHNLISYVSLVTDNESEPSLSNQNWQLVAKGATTQDVIAALRGSNLQVGEIVAQSIDADEITVDGKDVATEEYVGNYTKYAIDSIDIDQTGTTQVNVEYTFTGGGGGAVNILPATSTRAGAMSAADKAKLDSISPQGDHPVEVEADGNGDLDVSDDAGYVIGRFENGHIRTKNFYSGNIYTKSEVDNLIGSGGVTQQQLNTALATKQDTLVSGTNIKTINGTSLLGSGNITLSGDKAIYVKSCGAVGDGTTDDTAALETAFSLGYTNKLPVVFEDGTYLIRRPLTLRNNMEVFGLGNATIKKKTSSTTQLTAQLTAGSSTMTVASVSGFAVGDYICVSSTANTHPAARHCSVGYITAINTSTRKITFESAFKEQKVGAVKTHAVGCYVTNSCAIIRSWGTKYECIGAYVHNLTLDGNRQSGEFGDWMNGCIHLDAGIGTTEGVVYDKAAYNNTFKNLTIKNSPFDGISDQSAGGGTFENCRISNSYMHGIHLGTDYNGATIVNNTISNTEKGAAFFWCQNVENIIVNGNIINGCYKGCSDFEYGTAGQSSIITNNIFINVSNYVFDFSHNITDDFQGRIIINGNIIEQVNYIVGNLPNKTNVNITDNIIKDYATTPSYLFNLSSASRVILSCNLAPTITTVVNGTATNLINVNNSWN